MYTLYCCDHLLIYQCSTQAPDYVLLEDRNQVLITTADVWVLIMCGRHMTALYIHSHLVLKIAWLPQQCRWRNWGLVRLRKLPQCNKLCGYLFNTHIISDPSLTSSFLWESDIAHICPLLHMTTHFIQGRREPSEDQEVNSSHGYPSIDAGRAHKAVLANVM